MRFIFACGGTAGHINPALALADELRSRLPSPKILFVGAGRALEKSLIPRAGFHVVNVKMSGLRRGFSPAKLAHNVKTAKNLTTAGYKVANLLRRYKPDAVIGTGGYICYPVLKKAAKMGIPTIVHDSNAIPGLTTKLLSSIVDKVLVAFPEQEKLYRRPDRVIYTGTPVRKGFKMAAENRPLRAKDAKPLVVSFWGSLGAGKMNEAITEAIKLNIDSGMFDHIHAVGKKGGSEEMKHRLRDLGVADVLPPGIEIKEYIDDMPTVMAAADLVLCRGGGSTIAELMAMSQPSIIIPSPYVANNEQEENAKAIGKSGGAILLHEKTCTGEVLYEAIVSLITNEEKLAEMTENLKTFALPDATKNVADIILKLVEQ